MQIILSDDQNFNLRLQNEEFKSSIGEVVYPMRVITEHDKLKNLGYDESGHTGFARSEHTHDNYVEQIEVNGTVYEGGNKITLPNYPEKLSELTNDADFVTSSYHDATKQDLISFNTQYDASTNKAATMSDIQNSGFVKAVYDLTNETLVFN